MTRGYEVIFNGVPLHDYVLITGIERSVLPPRNNLSKSIPSMYGEHYLGHNYEVREVKIKAFLEASSQADRNEGLYFLADILNVSKPVKVVTSDDPDKYFYAVPDKINQERFTYNEEIEIVLKCYDVYKYALYDDFFQPNAKNVVTVNNAGSVEAYPVTTIEFMNKAYFVQCTNYLGETILIGQRPSIDKPNSTGDTKPLVDPCESMANWLPAGNVVESGYQVSGAGQVNGGGFGIICGDYGSSSTGWHGVALRRNIGQNVRDFEATFTLEHNSKGDIRGVGSSIYPPATDNGVSVDYVITADPCLRVRSDRNTSSNILTKIPNGTKVSVSDIQNNWGKVTYNSQTGYICMDYTKKYEAPTVETYTIKATDNVNVRTGAGTSYKILTTAKKGTTTTAKSNETVNGWYKVTVNGKTGYTCAKYWNKTKTTRTSRKRSIENPSAENRLGRIEVYGFGQNQERLFRCVLVDSEQWFEYTKPEVYIGGTKVWDDERSCPSPFTKTEVDKDGNSTTTDIDSGRFGDWNDFYGNFIIRRETNSNGQQAWKITVEKIEGGQVVNSKTTSTLINASYPKADLNHIVVWFGQYKDNPVVDTMSINHVEVKNLVPYKPIENRPIFWAGDELTINHNTNKVYLNGRPFMEELDIGSQFFSVPTGESAFVFASDDTNADIEVSLTKRYL